SRLLGGVVDERRAQLLQAVPSAKGEQLLPPADVILVAQSGMARLQLEFGHVRRSHHALRIDGDAVLDNRGSFVHDDHISSAAGAGTFWSADRSPLFYSPGRGGGSPKQK